MYIAIVSIKKALSDLMIIHSNKCAGLFICKQGGRRKGKKFSLICKFRYDP